MGLVRDLCAALIFFPLRVIIMKFASNFCPRVKNDAKVGRQSRINETLNRFESLSKLAVINNVGREAY